MSPRRGVSPDAHVGRARLPAVAAVVVAGLLYATLPSSLILGPRIVVPAIGLVLLVPLLLANVHRRRNANRELRIISVALVALMAIVNTISLVLLVKALVDGDEIQGTDLLVAALQVWLTNLIVFALIYWELDRGGPIVRLTVQREDLPSPDFRFTQDEDDDAVHEVAQQASGHSDWRPTFIDYLYVSCTNSTAFSPTDTMPLTSRAKLLMGIESIEALVLSILVIARAVSLLG